MMIDLFLKFLKFGVVGLSGTVIDFFSLHGCARRS